MKKLAVILALSFAPSLAVAEQPPPKVQAEARIVPAMRDGKLEGFKIYAIRAGERLERSGLRNGDTILAVDGEATTTDAGQRALHDKVMNGSAESQVKVRRAGKEVTVSVQKRQ